jgi:crotonobetainyl-CoA:carnitine CoA-transferase CaiB-like acyl-CoA transferase
MPSTGVVRTGAADAGAKAALGGICVLDLSDSIAGQFCGRLFADNGADVLLGEPAGGTPMRQAGPFAEIGGEPMSCLFENLNAGKRAIRADLSTREGSPRPTS